jgi:hypothetical protein
MLSGEDCCAFWREERRRGNATLRDIHAKRFRQLEIAVEFSYINAQTDKVLCDVSMEPRVIEFLREGTTFRTPTGAELHH